MAAIAPASATRFTFSSKGIVPRSINATLPASPSAGMSSANAIPAEANTPVLEASIDSVMGSVRNSEGTPASDDSNSTLERFNSTVKGWRLVPNPNDSN